MILLLQSLECETPQPAAQSLLKYFFASLKLSHSHFQVDEKISKRYSPLITFCVSLNSGIITLLQNATFSGFLILVEHEQHI